MEYCTYLLRIEGDLLKKQRKALEEFIAYAENLKMLEPYEFEAFYGIQNLLDAIADQAHDNYGIDCLLLD